MSERDMRALLKLIGERIGLSYADIVAWLERTNSLHEIEERILRGDYANALVGTQDAALRLAADVQEQYVTAGRHASQWLDTKVPALVRFDTASPAVVQRARMNQLSLVQGFALEQNQVARQIAQRAIAESATLGVNPRRVAQDFRASIGLTAQQEEHVANYRRYLEQGDWSRALSHELSSGHVDRTVRRLQRDGGSMTPAQIDAAVDARRANGLTHRAETIARTEALRNAHDGADDAIRQAIGRGDVEAEQLEEEWHAGPAGPSAREDHQAMDGVRIPFGTMFTLPDGVKMRGPGDPAGGAKHCASCRCTKSTTLR